MSNILKRAILFFSAVPGLALMIFFVPHLKYLWVTILLATIGVLCGREIRQMLLNYAKPLPLWSIAIPGIAPILGWITSMGWVPPISASIALNIGLVWAFGDAIFAKKNELSKSLNRIGTRLLIIIYPGVFLWWIQALTQFAQTSSVLLTFIFAVFLNDATAWLFGMILGKRRSLIAVSPNKSLEGFVSGIIASIAVIFVASRLAPKIFPHPLWQIILFGLITGILTIVGDLVESAIKRAAGVKDSGRIILGRGGMLDSMDSLLFTAPLFVLFLQMGT